MYTLADLQITEDDRAEDGTKLWERVFVTNGEHAGRMFLVGHCNFPQYPGDYQDWDEETFINALIDGAWPYPRDTWVMEAVVGKNGEWDIMYECNEECATGVCRKRLASNHEIGDQELGYKMLLDALNA